MFISIDAEKCMGHGRCYSVAPDLLSDDDEGFVAERGRCWQVPDEQLDLAYEAADACPESAIALLETAPADA
ncbi:ferredoxin [Nocardioides alkalitolerans]|uniref:ferredoxin n=1 Tax=Nocardioides alkalitolerans TaxID=281714 RepID=UPI000409EB75|nr:ferredoxin [Nocardioides alkalitolerans]